MCVRARVFCREREFSFLFFDFCFVAYFVVRATLSSAVLGGKTREKKKKKRREGERKFEGETLSVKK